MKKLFFLVLIISITSETFAQYQPDPESIFEIPASSVKRKFLVELGQGDKMQIELTNVEDLKNFSNVDSILAMFLRDSGPLRDSLSGGIHSQRIDYIVDTSKIKKFRIHKKDPASSHYAVTDGQIALLKLAQDTITIVGKVKTKIKAGAIGYYNGYAYYRLSFYLNDLNNISLYVDGKLNEKVGVLSEYMDTEWMQMSPTGRYLKKDPDIMAPNFRGLPETHQPASLRFAVNIQNYKNYFVPSISYGLLFIRITNMYRHKFGAQYENHFQFARDGDGKLQTYRNDFATVMYERENVVTLKSYKITPTVSLGYLVRNKGDFYEDHTFRLGLGRFAPFGGTLRIEPSLYFNDFLKGVTPSLRLTQYL